MDMAGNGTRDHRAGGGVGVAGKRMQKATSGGQLPVQSGAGERALRDGKVLGFRDGFRESIWNGQTS